MPGTGAGCGEWGGVTVLGRAARLPPEKVAWEWHALVCLVPSLGKSRTTRQSLPGASL